MQVLTLSGHGAQCSWHCDQYESECDCGKSRPRTAAYVERELRAAIDREENARDAVRYWMGEEAKLDAPREK